MGSSKSTTTQDNAPYKPAQPLINEGLREAGQMWRTGGFEISPYQGDLVADTDPFKEMAYGATPGIAGDALSGAQAAQGGLMRALDPNARSDAWGQVQKNVIDGIMPGINGSFAGSGMTGSTLHQQNLAKGLSAGLADVENQAWQQGENRALAAANSMGQANQGMFAPLDYMRSVGDERQQQAQSEIQADVFQDQQAQTAELRALQDYMALTTGAGGMFGVQSQTTSQNPGFMGYAGLGLQAAPLLFSDRRLKTDIKRVGYLDNGLPIYTYKYAGDDLTHMGVMADELETVKPHAVQEVAGYKAVDYGAI